MANNQTTQEMKTIFYAWALIFLTTSGRAQERGHYELISVNETIEGKQYAVTLTSWERQKLEITVEKPANVPLEISIRTADRQLLSSERANRLDQRFRRIINLTQLETGRYWLAIWIGKEVIHRELRIESTQQTYRVLTMH